jgi:hypothetical protein
MIINQKARDENYEQVNPAEPEADSEPNLCIIMQEHQLYFRQMLVNHNLLKGER